MDIRLDSGAARRAISMLSSRGCARNADKCNCALTLRGIYEHCTRSIIMGKRGPKSHHPSGVGYWTPAGYHRVLHGGRLRMAHDVAWEERNGPIPPGMIIHHINENPGDNALSNLQLVDRLTHKRLHSGCDLRDGVWWKPCSVCLESKPVDKANWYFDKNGWVCYGRCRPCHISIVGQAKRARRQTMAQA